MDSWKSSCSTCSRGPSQIKISPIFFKMERMGL